MNKVRSIKWFVFILSEDGKNNKNIESLRNKSLGTRKQIFNMVKGLGSYTFECALIYMNSLIRRSILYACESYYNLTEHEIRSIESIEEHFLIQLFDTGSKCPRHMLWLESGQIPTRHIIQLQRLY